MTMLPDRGVGVAVFTNRSGSPVPDILANDVFDRACGKEPVPWLDRHRERRRKSIAQLEVDRRATRRSGGRTRGPATNSATMPAITSIPAMAG